MSIHQNQVILASEIHLNGHLPVLRNMNAMFALAESHDNQLLVQFDVFCVQNLKRARPTSALAQPVALKLRGIDV